MCSTGGGSNERESIQASPSSILFDVLHNNEQVDENDAITIENFIGKQSRFSSTYNLKC
jgi:hypothetical protein